MGMAQTQDIPLPKNEESKWSMRKLFPFASATNAIVKQFNSAYEILLGFTILVVGIIEVSGHQASWLMYVVAMLLLGASVYERKMTASLPDKKEKK